MTNPAFKRVMNFLYSLYLIVLFGGLNFLKIWGLFFLIFYIVGTNSESSIADVQVHFRVGFYFAFGLIASKLVFEGAKRTYTYFKLRQIEKRNFTEVQNETN